MKIYTIDTAHDLRFYFSILCFSSFFSQKVNAETDSSKVERRTLYKALAFTGAYYATSISILNNTWYKGKEKVPFHFYNDNAGYLKVDKFGHMFGGYIYSYIGYHGLLKLGSTRNEALIFGSTLGFVLQFPIEIMDGLHEGYGFSWGDVAANTGKGYWIYY